MNNDIKKVLEEAGVPHPGRHRFTTNYLPQVLHKNERIMGAVFGRRKESEGFFGFVEGILVATDKRVLFVDHRPGYTTMDEIAYDKVSGVNISSTIFYASVTLFTKIANYHLSFASHESARKFADYIETRIIEGDDTRATQEKPAYETASQDTVMDFLNTHEVGVLSSVERTGAIAGAVIYYTIIDSYIYFMTKLSSKKAANILGNQHIAFTVFDESKLQTVQLQGIVEQVDDQDQKARVFTSIAARPRTYEDGSHEAPIVRMGGSDFVAYKIVPTKFTFTDYRQR